MLFRSVSIVTLIYYLKLLNKAFFGKSKDYHVTIKEPPLTMRLSILVLAAICLFAGLLLLSPARNFLTQAVDVLVSGIKYKDILFGVLK